jgi:hypothetical protein
MGFREILARYLPPYRYFPYNTHPSFSGQLVSYTQLLMASSPIRHTSTTLCELTNTDAAMPDAQ